MVNKIARAWRLRSFKREMAAFAMLFYMWQMHRHLSVLDPALVSAQAASFNTMTIVLLPIIAAAYGVDAWFKQGPKA